MIQRLQQAAAITCAVSMFFAFAPSMYAANIAVAPPQIQAALFVKLLSFHNGINGGGDISVHVIGAPDFAAEMTKIIGVKIGQSTLTAINEGEDSDSLTEKPSAIYIGDASKLDDVIRYTRANKVLSMTGIPELVSAGITLGIGVSGGKPRVLLNISSSKDEDIDWNHAILKVSTTFE